MGHSPTVIVCPPRRDAYDSGHSSQKSRGFCVYSRPEVNALESKLFDAAREGRAQEVADLLAQGVDPNARWKGEYDHGAFLEDVTPLMVACASPRSNAETVRALLEGGADLYAVSAGEVTALWYAAGGGTGYPLTERNLANLDADHPFRNWGGGDVDRLRLLLDAGANPNETADNGRSAVGEACSVGDPKRLALLIERGGSVQPSKRDTMAIGVPLFQAASSGSAECVRLVLAQGFPADHEQGGKTALHDAAGEEVAQVLLDAGAIPRSGAFGFDPIDEAFEHGEYNVALVLLRRLTEAERQRTLDRKLVTEASRRNVEAVRILLEAGANPRYFDPGLGTALRYACWMGDSSCDEPPPANTPQVIDMLIAAGADIEARDPNGRTPLHEAAEGDWGAPTAIRALLAHGAQVDPVDSDGRTPLMLAADRGELECARLLLEAGADPDRKDKHRRTARDYARRHLASWRQIASKPGSWLMRKMLRWTGAWMEDINEQALANAEAVVRLFDSRPA